MMKLILIIPDTQAVLERFMSNMSAGFDEQGRFAPAQFGEVPLQWICLSNTMYMFRYMKCIYNVYHSMYMFAGMEKD
jgi:hypothetical protein